MTVNRLLFCGTLAAVCCAFLRLPAQELDEIGSSSISTADEAQVASYGSSLLESVIANNESLTSYDLLVTYSTFYDKPGIEGKSFKRVARQLFTRASNRHLIAAKTFREVLSAEDKKSADASVFAAIFAEGPRLYFTDGIKHGTEAMKTLESARYRMRWPREETMGLVKYPFRRDMSGIDFKVWDYYSVPATGVKGEVLSDTRAKVTLKYTTPVNEEIIHTWIFDTTKLMPIERRAVIYNPTSGKRFNKEREVYTWQEASGIYVPEKIECETLQSFYDDSGTIQSYIVYTDSSFDWISVNENLSDSAFSTKRVESLDAIQELLDSQ